MNLARLGRRIAMSVGIGRILLADESKTVQQLQVALPGSASAGQQVREGIPSMQHFGFASSPQAGADAVTVFMSGDQSKGDVIATNDQRFRPTTLLPGEVMIFDAFGHSIHLSAAGITSIGNWAHTGTITSSGDIVAGGISLKLHEHVSEAAGTPTSAPIAGT